VGRGPPAPPPPHAGMVPRALIVSGRRAPADIRDSGVHRLDDAGLLAELSEMSGTDARLLSDPAVVSMIMPALRADYRAAETYVYQPGPPLRSPIQVLVSDADPRVTVDEAHRWCDYTTAGFDLQVFPGGHFYLTDNRTAVVTAIARHCVAGQHDDAAG
jgi:pyochelin biosynthetic protein PchC